MTMMMTSSQFGLEDMEALLWGPSSPTVDPRGLSPDQREPHDAGGTSGSEGAASPSSPLCSSLSSSFPSPPPFYSPPPSPAQLLRGDKAGEEADMLSFPWMSPRDHPGRPRAGAADSRDVFSDLDWMAERVDLSDLDLDSLIGSCSPDEEEPETPSAPEDLLASLDCSMKLDFLRPPSSPASSSLPAAPLPCPSPSPLPTASLHVSPVHGPAVPSPAPCVPEPQEELEIKCEPASPAPPSPAYTLDLGSEVDVPESEVDVPESEVKPAAAPVIAQVPRVVLTLSPTRIILLLAPKGAAPPTATAMPTVVRPPAPASPPSVSTRSRPYPDPRAMPSSSSSSPARSRPPRGAAGDRAPLKAPRDKKTKKMEQNKTAATRYRQKKRKEQDNLSTEYSELERRNIELVEKAESMAREIQYLKDLMDEVRLARIKKGLSADI